MCGICGIIRFDNKSVQEAHLREMMRIMKHRGPDDEGIFIKDNTGLGFVRLSIIDLSMAGHQPMFSTDKRYVILLNGEIYNYIELREELKSKGYIFRSGSDTEVLLNSYIEWGKLCLHRLNGMFAFIVLDTYTNELFAARDRFGIKPFYFYRDKNQFLFASDIPPVLKILSHKKEPEDSVIFDYLVFNRTNQGEKTFFKNIQKLQHGHFLTINSGQIEINRWYSLPDQLSHYSSIQFNENDFLEELKSSVNLQLRSDVPVGTCLSGGIDSSAITALVLNNKQNVDLHSFSAVYQKDQKGDESEYISEFKEKNLKLHYTFPTDESLIEDLNKFVFALSEPFPSTSIYAEYKVMELAKKHCTVLLNGQGADELMAGYHYFYGYYFRDLIKTNSWGKFLNEVFQYTRTHKSVYGLKTLVFSMSPRSLRHFKNHDFIDQTFYYDFYNKTNSLFDVFYKSKTLKEFLINHFEYKFEHHLLWADKTGMQFSLETRFPFLDHNLVEKTLSIPSENYIKNGYTKVIMRNALKDILPEKIRMRKDKVGFSTPEADWFKNKKLQNILQDIIESDSFKGRGYFDVKQCKKEFKSFQNYHKYNPEFWKWINLELWFSKFIDQAI
jgi:asparagine synthase (glutamine-hydrolysing)